MAHELSRLISSIYNQPLLISEPQLNSIEEYLDLRNGSIKAVLDNNKREVSSEELQIENGVGVIPIQGAITSKANLLYESLCGMVSYETVLSKVHTLCNMDDVHTIVLDVDSGGGEALNMVSSSREIRQLCRDSNKKLIGFANGCAASAAYGLISACDEIIMTSDSTVGSIGVLLALRNTNKKDEKEGVSTTYITSGAEKIPYDKETMEFRKEFLDDLQERVDEMYVKFTTLVSDHRGMSLASVKNTEAKMFSSSKALELGLVDKVMEPSEFYNYISLERKDIPEPNTPAVEGSKIKSTQKVNSMTDTIDMAAFEAMQKELAELKAEKLANETAAKKSAIEASLEDVTFMSNKASIVDFIMSAEDGQVKLVTALIDDAKTHLEAMNECITQAEQKASADIAALQEKLTAAETEAANAKAEADKVIAEFGTKQDSVESTPAIAQQTKADGVDRTAQLAAIVARKKANK